MSIDTIISEYLSGAGKRIIIPGFGAFIKRDAGEIVFIDMLTADDGLLAELVSRHNGISAEKANAEVEEYSLRLRSDLAKNRYAAIEGLGVVTVSADGKLRFTASANQPDAHAESRQTEAETDLNVIRKWEKAAEPAVSRENEVTGTSIPHSATPQTEAPISAARESGSEPAARKDFPQTAEPVKLTEFDLEIRPRQEIAGAGNEAPGKPAPEASRTNAWTQKKAPQRGWPSKNDSTPPQSGDNAKSAPVAPKAPDTERPVVIDYGARPRIRQRTQRKKVDAVMIVAIIAIVIAIAVIVYGRVVESGMDFAL